MKKNVDMIDVLFNDDAKKLLFSKVDRVNPNGIAQGNDDVFEPTISSVFTLFNQLLFKNTPDLYRAEWETISKALEPKDEVSRLPRDLTSARRTLILSLEDLHSEGNGFHSFELAHKIAGFEDIQICAIFWHIQSYHVALTRNEEFEFPSIQIKG